MKAVDQKPEDVVTPIINAQEPPQGLNNITSNLPQINMTVGLNQVTKICSLYRIGTFPHGLYGNKLVNDKKCELERPKSCRRYMAYGSRGPRGCRPGSNCTLYHPVLCRYSVKDRICTNQNCSFTHLKGTRRRREDFVSENQNDQANKNQTKFLSTKEPKSKNDVLC